MYFKTMIKKISNEIIEKESKIYEQLGVKINFNLETLYKYEDLLMTCTQSSNFNKLFEIHRKDLEKENKGADEYILKFYFICDYVIAFIEWEGYDFN